MVNYQKSKIYKIISTHTDKCYVGSTTKDRLSNRLAGHRSAFKTGSTITSKYILELGDYEIVLLELYPCNSKDELHMRERHYIETLDCVNRFIPGRTVKEYRLNNKDKTKEYSTKYVLENKESISKHHAQYYQNNKEDILKKNIEHYLKNKEMIKQKVKIKITCECGCLIRKSNILKHKTTKKHLDLIQSSL